MNCWYSPELLWVRGSSQAGAVPGLWLMSSDTGEGGSENLIAFIFCLDGWEKCDACKDDEGNGRKNLQRLGKSLEVGESN